jgi:membrane-associated phospholipid phosphatase
LWSAYQQHLEGFGFGVSAMPSVHVASAMVVALFGFAQSRLLGVILSVVALCTFVSSVTLGWHYPLDGYIGALVALVIWWAAGLVSRNG